MLKAIEYKYNSTWSLKWLIEENSYVKEMWQIDHYSVKF